MFDHLILYIFLATWTIIIGVCSLWGYILQKRQFSRILPSSMIQQQAGETTFGVIGSNLSKTPLPYDRNKKQTTQEFNDFFNMNNQQNDEIIETPLEFLGKQLSSKQSPRLTQQLNTAEGELQMNTPTSLRRSTRAQTSKRELNRKQTVVMPDGSQIDTYKLVQRTKKKKTSITPSNQFDNTPQQKRKSQFQQEQNQKQTKQQKSIEIRQIEYIPPSGKCYKYSEFSIILLKKRDLSKLYQFFIIYFRQIFCLNISGILVFFKLQDLSPFIIYGLCLGTSIILKVIDTKLIKYLHTHATTQLVNVYYIMIWIISIAAIIWLIAGTNIDDFEWLIYYSPAFVLDILIYHPIKQLLYAFCLDHSQMSKHKPIKTQKINVLKVINTIQ